jgi:hypothetical protein
MNSILPAQNGASEEPGAVHASRRVATEPTFHPRGLPRYSVDGVGADGTSGSPASSFLAKPISVPTVEAIEGLLCSSDDGSFGGQHGIQGQPSASMQSTVMSVKWRPVRGLQQRGLLQPGFA